MWTGKIIGATIGLMLGGRIGAIVGFILGHFFDLEIQRQRSGRGAAPGGASIQDSFFGTTFEVMGHIAKADGRVSEEEIRAARAVMSDFRLSEPDVQRAISFFTRGKETGYPLDESLRRLRQQLGNRVDLCRMFVQIQLQASIAAGGLNASSRPVMRRVAQALGISDYELAHLEALLRMRQQQSEPRNADTPTRLAEAYQVLGVSAQASDAEVSKAYRRLMSQNHPDKLVARGLPESMMKAAEEKTRQILAAYDLIREARGMR
jgi:DnaJ like chaperone protein